MMKTMITAPPISVSNALSLTYATSRTELASIRISAA
jgi:hypothetical protein